jgi:hypothetical protein
VSVHIKADGARVNCFCMPIPREDTRTQGKNIITVFNQKVYQELVNDPFQFSISESH